MEEINTCHTCGTPPVSCDPNFKYHVCDRCNKGKTLVMLMTICFAMFTFGLGLGMFFSDLKLIVLK